MRQSESRRVPNPFDDERVWRHRTSVVVGESRCRNRQRGRAGSVVSRSLIRALDPGVDLTEAAWDWPCEFKAQVLGKIAEQEWNRYPSNRLIELEQRLAALLAVPPDSITIAPGSMATIESFFRRCIVPAKAYVQPHSSFFMFRRIANRFSVEVRTFALGDNGQYDTADVVDACHRWPELPVILCAPNNPTGGHLSVPEVSEIAAATRAPILLDGTYSWFSESFDMKDLSDLMQFDHLLQSYSLSKAGALASARLGFAVLPPELKTAFDHERLPFTFNFFALSVLSVLVEDRWWRYMWDRIADVRRARQSLIAHLTQIDEIRLFPSQANFVTVAVGKRGSAVREAFSRAGLSFKSLGSGMFRITVGKPETMVKYADVICDAVRR